MPRSQSPVLLSGMNHSHTMPIIVQISRLFLVRNERVGAREFPEMCGCVCVWLQMACSMCAFVFTFVGLCSCLVCVFNPSLVQSSYCSVVVDRRCSEKGEGALVRKHLFDNIKLPVPYSAKRLKILEKGPTCA